MMAASADRGPVADAAEKTPSIWRLPEIRWIFAARVASVAGDWVYQIALVWLVLEVTGSPLALSAVALAQIIPLILMSGLLSGRLVRVITPTGLAAFDVAQAVVVLSFPLLYWSGQLSLAWFVVVAIVITLLDSVSDPGLQAIVPQLTDRARIPAVHSLLDLTKRLGRILGPGFTSLLLLLLPIAGLFVVDAVSFVLSAMCMLAAGRIVKRWRRAREALTGEPPAVQDKVSIRSTFAYLRANSILLWLFTVRNSQNLLWSIYLIGVPVLVQRTFHSGPGLWGALIAAYASGQLFGNFVTTRQSGYRFVVRYVLIGWVLAGLGFVGLGAFSSPLLGAVCLFIGGAGSAAANISSDSYVGITVPVAIQPGAFSWQFSGNQITQLAGTAAFGAILGFAPVREVVVITGLAMVVVVALGALALRRGNVKQVAV
jgi:MFS transporter, DHA3 family, macrolide efflux protein